MAFDRVWRLRNDGSGHILGIQFEYDPAFPDDHHEIMGGFDGLVRRLRAQSAYPREWDDEDSLVVMGSIYSDSWVTPSYFKVSLGLFEHKAPKRILWTESVRCENKSIKKTWQYREETTVNLTVTPSPAHARSYLNMIAWAVLRCLNFLPFQQGRNWQLARVSLAMSWRKDQNRVFSLWSVCFVSL